MLCAQEEEYAHVCCRAWLCVFVCYWACVDDKCPGVAHRFWWRSREIHISKGFTGFNASYNMNRLPFLVESIEQKRPFSKGESQAAITVPLRIMQTGGSTWDSCGCENHRNRLCTVYGMASALFSWHWYQELLVLQLGIRCFLFTVQRLSCSWLFARSWSSLPFRQWICHWFW